MPSFDFTRLLLPSPDFCWVPPSLDPLTPSSFDFLIEGDSLLSTPIDWRPFCSAVRINGCYTALSSVKKPGLWRAEDTCSPTCFFKASPACFARLPFESTAPPARNSVISRNAWVSSSTSRSSWRVFVNFFIFLSTSFCRSSSVMIRWWSIPNYFRLSRSSLEAGFLCLEDSRSYSDGCF